MQHNGIAEPEGLPSNSLLDFQQLDIWTPLLQEDLLILTVDCVMEIVVVLYYYCRTHLTKRMAL
jgi:hypothetical protein